MRFRREKTSMEPDPDFMDIDEDFDDAEFQAALLLSLEVRLRELTFIRK